jgi:hypothetical protein
VKTRIIKTVKIIGIVILFLLLSLITLPYLFENQIKTKIAQIINEKVDAKVSFADARLSLFKNFPNATVQLDDLLILNKAPFEGDTLIAVNKLDLKMSIKELFKGKEEALIIDGFFTEQGLINVIINENGIGNFDIALKEDKSEEDTGKSKPLSLKIKEYQIVNYQIRYTDRKSKMKMVISELNHEGKGDFSSTLLDLNTKTTAKISFDKDKVNFLNHVSLSLEATLGIDLEKSKYTFKNNKAKINELPLEFDGSIQMKEKEQLYDLTFKTPTSSFKNFLGLIPSAYASGLNGVKTSGDFTINGFAKGALTDQTIPKFSIAITSKNGTFQYPNLPKSVRNIIIDTKIVNSTGLMNDTYVDLNRLSFRIDEDQFDAKANIKNLNTNALVDASLKGTINLGNLSKAYPIKLDKPLSGILKADLVTRFDMQSAERSDYQNIYNAGTIGLSQFKFVDETGKAFQIKNALVQFNPSRVNLMQFDAVTGKSDFNITGVLANFYGFMFKKQELKGDFNLQSNQLVIADFMDSTTPTTTVKKETTQKTAAPKEAMKIPAILNCSITAKANTVLYDNLTLKDFSGKLIVKDQKATLEKVKTSIFGGTINAEGAVSTKEKIPVFTMNLGFNQLDIQQSFTQLDLLKSIAPVAGIINGKMNSTINLSGYLDPKEMTPDMKSLSGDLTGQLLSTTINENNSALLNAIGANFKFIDLNKLDLNNLKIALTFKDSRVNVKPFDIKYLDIKATIGGTHGFDQTLNYTANLLVPAKYLGTEINQYMAKLSANGSKKLENIPVNAIITGNFNSPKVTSDMKQAILNATKQVAIQHKDELIDKGVNELGKLLGGKKKNEADTTKTQSTKTKEDLKNKAGDLINGLFGKKKKE